eukprot:scaffold87146_cov81-Phaeocystis_antarctica.AAC.1
MEVPQRTRKAPCRSRCAVRVLLMAAALAPDGPLVPAAGHAGILDAAVGGACPCLVAGAVLVPALQQRLHPSWWQDGRLGAHGTECCQSALPVHYVLRDARRDARLLVYEHANVAGAFGRHDVLRPVVHEQSARTRHVAPRRDAVHVGHLGLGHVAQDAPRYRGGKVACPRSAAVVVLARHQVRRQAPLRLVAVPGGSKAVAQ